MSWSESVLPHGPLELVAEGLWQVRGSLPRMALPRNMLVYRMKNGGLWIHSAIALNESSMAELEKLGQPAVLVVPNGLHRLDAPAYKTRYPSIRVLCPAASREAVEKKLAVEGTVEAELPKLGIEVLMPAGVKAAECAYRLPVPGGAIAMCDLVFNLPHEKGFGGFILRVIGSTGFFGVSKIGRRFYVKDAEALATWFDELAATKPAIVTMAHGDAVKSGAATKLKEAAQRLRRGA